MTHARCGGRGGDHGLRGHEWKWCVCRVRSCHCAGGPAESERGPTRAGGGATRASRATVRRDHSRWPPPPHWPPAPPPTPSAGFWPWGAVGGGDASLRRYTAVAPRDGTSQAHSQSLARDAGPCKTLGSLPQGSAWNSLPCPGWLTGGVPNTGSSKWGRSRFTTKSRSKTARPFHAEIRARTRILRAQRARGRPSASV